VQFSFGLTALAADTGNRAEPEEQIVPEAHREDGKLAFAAGMGSASPEIGDYTGILFQVTGEGIAHVSMSLDRGGFYHHWLRDNMTEEQVKSYWEDVRSGKLENTYLSQDNNGVWYSEGMEALGSTVSEDYDPSLTYGFYVSPEDYIVVDDPDSDLRAESWKNIDLFDGATMTLTVTFEDGSEQTQKYLLHTGRLQVEYRDDLRTRVVRAEVVSEDSELPFIYGIYTEPVPPSVTFKTGK